MGKSLRRILIATLVGASLTFIVLPYAAGLLSYATTHGGSVAEQNWLDSVTDHLRDLRSDCTDPELKEVLDYTVRRYDQIGPFSVAVVRCDWYDWFSFNDMVTFGLNNPLVPGISIDLRLARRHSIHTGAMVLVHEALHDYPPYLPHGHITPVIDKLEDHYVHRQRNR